MLSMLNYCRSKGTPLALALVTLNYFQTIGQQSSQLECYLHGNTLAMQSLMFPHSHHVPGQLPHHHPAFKSTIPSCSRLQILPSQLDPAVIWSEHQDYLHSRAPPACCTLIRRAYVFTLLKSPS